jgi:3-oxoadipate enol-lactonase
MVSQEPEGVSATLLAMRDRPDSSALLDTIDVPVLGLAGALDVVSPPSVVEAMVRRAPRGRFEIIEKAGHLGNLEQSQAFNGALLRFARDV